MFSGFARAIPHRAIGYLREHTRSPYAATPGARRTANESGSNTPPVVREEIRLDRPDPRNHRTR
jgi:hypothetical protein